MSVSTLWGVLLITCGGVSATFGLYATKGNFKTKTNRLILIICLALLVWTSGLAITVSADNDKISMLGYLISPIGWAPMSGLLLHYTLLLTDKNRILNKWWIYPLLYGPGLLMIYAFTLLPAMGYYVDVMVYTSHGWIPKVNYDIWDYLFYIYYILYTVVNLTILVSTGIKSKGKSIKTKVTILAISYVITYILGSLTDIISGHYGILIPRHSTVFSLIPVGAMTYLIRRFGSMSQKDIKFNDKYHNDSEYIHNNIYRALGFGFIIGSIINIASQKLFYNETGLPSVGIFSIFLLFVALSMLLINKLPIKGSEKEMSVSFIFSAIIPFITLRFVQYGSITIWAFIFLLIIICLLYNRWVLLINITISSILTQILAWAISPQVMVEVNIADYLVRIGLINISTILAIFVNSFFSKKIKENILLVSKETILSEITRDFISSEKWNLDEIMYKALKRCGEFFDCERAYIGVFEENTNKYLAYYEWLSEESSATEIKDIHDPNLINKLLKQFETEPIVKLHDSHRLALTKDNLKKTLLEQNIRGVINIPLKQGDKIIGIMGFSSSKALKDWNVDSSDFIVIVSNLVSDILLKLRAEEKIEFLAYHDPLTGLPNRNRFRDILDTAISKAKSNNKLLGVVFINIDSFKFLNDTMGHDIADKLLINISQVFTRNIRGSDIISRLCGDEFIILLNDLSESYDAIKILDDIVIAIRKPINLQGQQFYITISAGCAIYPNDGDNGEALIKSAEIAMYKAKGLGKNRFIMCSQEMRNHSLEKTLLTANLHKALERNQLVVYYQPQINIETQTITGFEALLRWFLPGKGMVSPAVFIPIAEQNGLIHSIGEWVLETACEQTKKWHDQGFEGLRMAVNISVQQLNNPGFTKLVDNILKKTGLVAKYLELEITENTVSNNEDEIIKIMSELKALGLSISIDDFGTEYSSLYRLKSLPIDRIKMDIEFVRGIEGDEKDRAIAKVIINLAKTMGLSIVAEGVETQQQLNFLSQRMCDEVQGYYYYKPLPADEIEVILTQNYNKRISEELYD